MKVVRHDGSRVLYPLSAIRTTTAQPVAPLPDHHSDTMIKSLARANEGAALIPAGRQVLAAFWQLRAKGTCGPPMPRPGYPRTRTDAVNRRA